MTDINSSKRGSSPSSPSLGGDRHRSAKTGGNPLFLRDEELRQAIELLFNAYRDFTGEPDIILAQRDLGRAHHRVIYFVGRYPGMTVSHLLDILKITKQSLLMAEGYIRQDQGQEDRRQRLLTLTDKGAELERLLTETQRKRIARAYRNAGPDAVEGFRDVMLGIISGDADRARFENRGE